jgi:hypothetical protein
MKLLSVLVAVATIGSVHAYFRMECPGRTGLARMDPIVSPGGFSSHAHAVGLRVSPATAYTAILSPLPTVYS